MSRVESGEWRVERKGNGRGERIGRFILHPSSFILCLAGLALLAGIAAKPAPVRMAAGKNKQFTLEAPVFEYQEDRWVATGGAILRSDEGTVKAQKMNGSYLSGRVSQVEAEGNVKVNLAITGKDQTKRHIDSTSDRASYNPETQELVLVGNVKGEMRIPAKEQTISLNGSKAILDLKANRYRVEQATVTLTQPEKQPEAAPAK